MAITATIQVFEGNGSKRKNWTIEGDINGKLTFEEFQNLERNIKIRVAEQVLKEEQARGFDKNPRVRTDNQFEKPAVQVLPFGKIEYFARVAPFIVILGAYEEIEKRSPVDTGLYKSSNWVFLNGQLVAKNSGELKKWVESRPQIGDNDFIRFVNLTPYARKLELGGRSTQLTGPVKGATSGKTRYRKVIKKRVQTGRAKVPSGAYSLALRAIRQKYPSLKNGIKFSFIPGTERGVGSAVPVRHDMRTHYAENSKNGKKKRGGGRPYLYPSITVRFQLKGIQ